MAVLSSQPYVESAELRDLMCLAAIGSPGDALRRTSDRRWFLRYYINGAIILLMLWLVVGAWRLRRRRVTPGAAAAGMMHELLSEERSAAIEVIVEERTGYRDPEDRDGDFPNLADWKTLSPQTTSDGAAEAAPPRGHRLIVQNGATRMARVSSSFYRGMIAGIMAWAVVWGVGALLADMTASVPSYIRLAAIVNVAIGLVGFSVLYWREQRCGYRPVHP